MVRQSKPRLILNLIILTMIFLFVIGVVKDYTNSDALIWASGFIVTGLIAYGLWSYKEEGERVSVKPSGKHQPNEIPWWQVEGRPYRFIFTHSEEALDAIENRIMEHPMVENVFQDSGYWYSNGETGPEWYSMHVICKREDSVEVQKFVSESLKIAGHHADVRFMGSNN